MTEPKDTRNNRLDLVQKAIQIKDFYMTID